MVADATVPAGADEGAAGFEAAPGPVGFRQAGVVEDRFAGSEAAGEVAVNLFPGAVVFDGSGRAVPPDIVVEIPDGEDVGDARRSEGIHHGEHSRHCDGAAPLRIGTHL